MSRPTPQALIADLQSRLSELLRKSPLSTSLKVLRVTTLIQMELYEDAREEYLGMLKENENDLMVILGLAELYELMELKDEAVEYYSRALANDYILESEIQIVEERIEALKTGAAPAAESEAEPEPEPEAEPGPTVAAPNSES